MFRFLFIAILVFTRLPVFADPIGEEFARLNEWFARNGPKAGEAAPDFVLERARGGTLKASELWSQEPLLVTTGSYSCPQFREGTPARRELVKEFGAKMNFVVVYTTEAHPVGSKSPYLDGEFITDENKKEGILLAQPQSFSERFKLAQSCREKLKVLSYVAVDKMDNAIWKAYGASPNCAYLIDGHGKVVFGQGLFEPKAMRAAIRKLLDQDGC